MQTLKLTHRLDLRLVGVSGGTMAKLSSEMWIPKWRKRLDTIFGVNLRANNIILFLQLGNDKNNKIPEAVLIFYLYHPDNRSFP